MNSFIKNKFSISFQRINQFESPEDNIRFLKVKIWLMHIGENLNGSFFSKEVVTAALPTLANTPILSYIEENSEGELDFTDHRQIIIKKDGKHAVKYIGSAIGVIPSDNNAQFEDRLCDDGIIRTFLTVEGLCWRKFDDPIDILTRDIVKSESMELSDGYEGEFKEDGFFHFSKFSFFGACGLGLDVHPAMQNATIEVQFSESEFTKVVSEKIEIFKKIYSMKGDRELNNENFSWSSEQLEAELRRIVSQKITVDLWGYECSDYYYVDHLPEEKVVIAYDYDDKVYVGFNYSISGDIVTVDLEVETRYKSDWVVMNVDPENINSDGISFVPDDVMDYSLKVKEAELRKQFETEKESAVSELQTNLLDMDTKFSALESELTLLKEFKSKHEDQVKQEKIEEAFHKYSSLLEKEELEVLREKADTCENVDEFIRDFKSFACDKLLAKKDGNKGGHLFVGIPQTHETNLNDSDEESVWTRLKNKK